MLTKGSVTIGLDTRFGPNWPGVRCGARTKAGGDSYGEGYSLSKMPEYLEKITQVISTPYKP